MCFVVSLTLLLQKLPLLTKAPRPDFTSAEHSLYTGEQTASYVLTDMVLQRMLFFYMP